MAARKGKCIQFGGCSKADNREIIEAQAGEEFVCKECGKPLQEIEEGAGAGGRRKLLFVGAAAILLVAGGAVWKFWPSGQYPEEPTITETKPGSTLSQEKAQPKEPGKGSEGPQAPAYACGLNPVAQPDLNRLLTYLKQGMIYASQSRYEMAIKEFEQVQQIDPNFLAMHENIAAAQLKLQKLTDAEAHLQQELKLIGCLGQMQDGDLPKFAYMLEVGQKGAGDADAARTQTMRSRLKQASGIAHYNLACLRARQGSAPQALDELRLTVDSGFADTSALRRDPDLATVRNIPGFQEVLASANSKAAGRN